MNLICRTNKFTISPFSFHFGWAGAGAPAAHAAAVAATTTPPHKGTRIHFTFVKISYRFHAQILLTTPHQTF